MTKNWRSRGRLCLCIQACTCRDAYKAGQNEKKKPPRQRWQCRVWSGFSRLSRWWISASHIFVEFSPWKIGEDSWTHFWRSHILKKGLVKNRQLTSCNLWEVKGKTVVFFGKMTVEHMILDQNKSTSRSLPWLIRPSTALGDEVLNGPKNCTRKHNRFYPERVNKMEVFVFENQEV